ncbi:Xylose operon regulatory protein [Pseudobythopirellula maris]|uniref:Xylose operon regulatory protein n=1 Tax=Pseudobythopirellula maris TaxID=2527991 RepID=A0A5C5ZKC1_9BACT|nr:DNA-binding transcriptional regulator [Pseudobythopirellula maris]TWT87231.1 Xylose operon regulatory protein [Pseudobythopirellula maris]
MAANTNGETPRRTEFFNKDSRQIAVLIETDTSVGCSVIRGIANYAKQVGDWHLLIDPRDHEHRSALPDGWNGDGIIAGISSRLQFKQVNARNTPLVNVDDRFEDLPGMASVVTDENALAELALSHLLDRGFRHFGYFAPPSTQYSKKRGQAFITAVQQAGHKCNEYRPGYRAGRKISWGEQQRRVTRWLRSLEQPVAVLAVDSLHARQLSEICHATGIRVPDDIAILAGDTNELFCEVSTPPLSSVIVASEKIGHDAAELLDRMMGGESPPDEVIRVKPRGITSRQSTDLLAIDDPAIVDALWFIRKHAHRGIVVGDILREVPISRRYLEIQFQKYLGRSPGREIRRVQLERGKELLGRQELSITEIATACGFANSTRFGVAFKKYTLKTPYRYREELLAGQKIAPVSI